MPVRECRCWSSGSPHGQYKRHGRQRGVRFHIRVKKAFHVKAKLRSLAPQVKQADTRTTPLPPKQKDPIYNTDAFKVWRALVVSRAGLRCEAIDQHGHRCTKAHPEHRMYADHIKELKDNGSLLDINNGQCLCASHHELKTVDARKIRHQHLA